MNKISNVAKVFMLCAVAFNIHADNTIPNAPAWSTPMRGTVLSESASADLLSLTGSKIQYSQAQIDDKFSAPDWFPAEHAAMPDIVKKGRAPGIWACASCHLASGLGHPESSALAGLEAAYIEQQLNDFASGSRLDYSGHMNRMGALLTTAEKKEAAAWFSSLTYRKFITVVETTGVPETVIDDTRMRVVNENGKTEALGQRIIEVPENMKEVKLRSPYSQFISYVPVGSIARGKNIVTTGGGKAVPCTACHGANLKGTAIAPNITGNFGIYIVRQLHGFKSGTRKSAQMASIVAPLNDGDIIDIAAYLSTLDK